MIRSILRFAGWAIALTALLFGVIVVVAQLSGRQKPLGIVSATARRHDVELRSGLVETNGTQLHVVQAGPADGPPVILLHGFPEFWWAWHEQIARLARAGFRVIAPDQRGYNASDKPEGIEAYQVDQLTGDILGMMDALDIRQAYLAGHDWGGAIAWYLVIEHPERFKKLVMFNSAHPGAWAEARKQPAQEETINWFRTFFQIPWLPEVTARLGNWGLLTKNLRDTSRAGTFPESDLDYYRYAWDRDGAMGAMINWYRAIFRYPKALEGDGKVGIPTRIVWGMQDRFFENRMGRLSVEQCSDATLVELPDAGHWLLHEEPERTSREMIEFFGKGR